MVNEPVKMIILAGGFGTRLRSVVPDLPKPLAPVAGKPFLQYLIESWVAQQVTHFIFSLHYQAETMMHYIDSIRHTTLRNCEVSTVVEETPLGTGGAVAYVIDQLHLSGDFVVTNADTWTGNNGVRKIIKATSPAIAVTSVSDTGRYGRVELEGPKVMGFLEKLAGSGAGHINAGTYLLNTDHFQGRVPRRFSIEEELFPSLVRLGTLTAVQLNEEFIDIGVPEDYSKFSQWVENKGRQQ